MTDNAQIDPVSLIAESLDRIESKLDELLACIEGSADEEPETAVDKNAVATAAASLDFNSIPVTSG